jgi:uncharacterized protein YodC (DUF2158 family)
MDRKLEIGDRVKLNSGGCEMTVRLFDIEGITVCCNWHNKDGKPEQNYYAPAQLVLVTD